MDSSSSMARLAWFQKFHDEMFSAMDEGTLVEWAAEFMVEEFQFVLAPDFDNSEEDGISYGRDNFIRYYNNILRSRFPPGATWTFEQSFQFVSHKTYLVDVTLLVHAPDAPPEIDPFRMIFTFSDDDRLSFFLKCPRTPENVMSDSMVLERDVIPPSEIMDEMKAPCQHNSWDSIRGKQTLAVLRCRECDTIWKIRADLSHAYRCSDFREDACPYAADSCRRIHIHPRKVRQCNRAVPLECVMASRKRKPRPGKNARMRMMKNAGKMAIEEEARGALDGLVSKACPLSTMDSQPAE
eukprot:gene15976-24448_t